VTQRVDGGGQQPVTAACQREKVVVMADVGAQARLLALFAFTLRIHQTQRGPINLVVTTEQLPDRVLRHFFSVGIGFLLYTPTEILLKGARQLQTVVLLQQPGRTTFPRLAVNPNHRFITAADIRRVEGQIGHLPHGFLLLCAPGKPLFDRILMRTGKRGEHQFAGIGMTRMDGQFIAGGDDLNHAGHVTEIQSGGNTLGIKI